ncbi:isoprenylcysteine carboxylmethyltransferase family protein [Candidatus Dojkabacteria bacterium]|nr:isoprenylcysteine carboxylmethyltransferase family protein [Candidatus Dojkabacteria bacterium]
MPNTQNSILNRSLVRVFIYAIVFFLIQFFSSQYEGPTWLETVGIIMFFLGITMYTIGLNNLSIQTAFFESSKTLVTTGIYSIVRHPLYTAVAITYLGAGIWNQSIAGILTTLFILIPVLFYFAREEEKDLITRFGEDYINYKKKTLF